MNGVRAQIISPAEIFQSWSIVHHAILHGIAEQIYKNVTNINFCAQWANLGIQAVLIQESYTHVGAQDKVVMICKEIVFLASLYDHYYI